MGILTANLLALTMKPGKRYEDWRWRYIARTVRKRDGYRCRECVNSGLLDVHHKRPVSRGGSHFTWNLKTLCRSCHTNKHPHMRIARRAAFLASSRTVRRYD